MYETNSITLALVISIAFSYYYSSIPKRRLGKRAQPSPIGFRPGSRDRVAHFDTSSFDNANEYDK